MEKVTLSGNGISLIPLNEEDFEALYLVGSDPAIWEQHPNSDRYQKEVFKSYFQKLVESDLAFLIWDTGNNKIIGSSCYYDFDSALSQIAIGYTFLAKNYWGGTTNKIVKHLMIFHAFTFVETVIFHVGVKNLRSQKALEKIGATRTETILDITNSFPEKYIYRIKKLDFNS